VLSAQAGTAAAAGGTIKGRVRLGGTPPGNPVIRMRVDPMCAKINKGKLVVEEIVMTSKDGGLANVFVKLQGSFPRTAVPTGTVMIDQHGCVYTPRMVGARVGQTLLVRNSDPLLHNVHSLSSGSNSFNIGQPVAGLENRFQLKAAEILRLKCDVHRWMTAYVGVVDHPYFAVSGTDGAFEIANVPAGTHAVHIWHERYGDLEQSIHVNPGATATVTFTYTGAEKAP
jgi:plastocyanin